jgi:hypothetical protein
MYDPDTLTYIPKYMASYFLNAAVIYSHTETSESLILFDYCSCHCVIVSDFDTSLELKYFPKKAKGKTIRTQYLGFPGDRQSALEGGKGNISGTHFCYGGGAVVGALRCKPEGRGFDFQ